MNKNIEHLHFEECESTQLILKQKLNKEALVQNLLISSPKQSHGRGRSGKIWESIENSIAMSFILNSNPEITLTSLEVGVLLCRFFKDHSLQLKWPNDILNSNALKCAGILCQSHQGKILVGIGLNYGNSKIIESSENFKFGRSYITDSEISSKDVKDISYNIYSYIIHNRLSINDTISYWNDYCCHLDKKVEIRDNNTSVKGVSRGIGTKGEALVENKGGIEKVYTGSLFLS